MLMGKGYHPIALIALWPLHLLTHASVQRIFIIVHRKFSYNQRFSTARMRQEAPAAGSSKCSTMRKATLLLHWLRCLQLLILILGLPTLLHQSFISTTTIRRSRLLPAPSLSLSLTRRRRNTT